MGNKNILFLESLNKNIQNNSFFNSADWRNYFTKMAGRESSYRSDAYNPSGAYGYFQLMPYNRRGKDIDTQFNDVFDLTLLHLQLLSANMTEQDYRKAELYGIDIYGLAAGAHLGGPGGVLRVLRGKGNPKDSNGTSVLLYMLEFSGTQDPNNVIYGDLNEYFALPQEELNYEIPDILSSTEEDLNVLNADLDGLDDWINYIINVERKTPEYKQKLLEYNEAIARYKALGGPINTNNPILNFSLFKGQLPVVRYSLGGELDNSIIPSSNSVKPNLFYDGGDTITSQFLDQVLADREAEQQRKEELASSNDQVSPFYDGYTEASQLMNNSSKPNIFRRLDGSYFYSADGKDEVDVTPVNTLLGNPSEWTYTDDNGKLYTPKSIDNNNLGVITQGNNEGPIVSAVNNYLRELLYKWDNNIPIDGKYTMPAIAASALLPLAGTAFANTTLAGIPATTWADAALTAGFGAHGLNHAINEGVDGWGDAVTTASEILPLGRLAKPMWNAGKKGLKYAAKTADATARFVSPSYDLYKTIGETTPRTTPTLHSFYCSDLVGTGFVENSYTGSPIFEFGQTMRTSPEKAYFMRAPRDVDVLKLGNGRFRSELVGNELIPSGEVNGKFVSYGEPWKEFALGENSALYVFPVGPRRGPSLMATDWKGRQQKYSVDEIYDYMLKENNLRAEFNRDVMDQGINKLKGTDRVKAYRALKKEKYPELLEHYDTSIYGANQTVVPNERWNFDKFLKTPFWKYYEDPASGQVQRELIMRWPEAKRDVPTINWAEATAPQITAENAAKITPEQWTVAQDAAIARGDMAEAQSLRDLHFKVKAPNTKIKKLDGELAHMYHGTSDNWVSYDPSKFGSATDDGWYGVGLYATEEIPAAKIYGNNVMDLYVNAKNPFTAGVRDIKGTPYSFKNATDRGDIVYYFNRDRKNTDFSSYPAFGDTNFSTLLEELDNADAVVYSTPEARFKEVVIPRGEQIKSADAVTFDDNGIRIPLGKRDNFNRNDIRYGFIPPVAAGLGLSLYNLDNQMLHYLGGHLNKFEEGGNTDDTKYQAFLEDLKNHAPNLATPSRDYNMRRYWELRGKPSNWAEALRDFNYLYNVKEDPMFTLEDDGFYHAPSAAFNLNTGIIEFMKSADHPTVKYELNWYDNGDETGPNGLRIPSFEGFKSSYDFKLNYELLYSPIENKYYYVPRANKKVEGGD